MARANLLQSLTQIWLNEHFNPKLTYHEDTIVNASKEAIQALESRIDELEEEPTADSLFKKQLYECEIARVNYLLCAYMKARLKKVVLLLDWV